MSLENGFQDKLKDKVKNSLIYSLIVKAEDPSPGIAIYVEGSCGLLT